MKLLRNRLTVRGVLPLCRAGAAANAAADTANASVSASRTPAIRLRFGDVFFIAVYLLPITLFRAVFFGLFPKKYTMPETGLSIIDNAVFR